MTYAERIIEQVKAKNAEQPEFIQAAISTSPVSYC